MSADPWRWVVPRVRRCCCLPLRAAALLVGYASLVVCCAAAALSAWSLARVVAFVQASAAGDGAPAPRVARCAYAAHALLLLALVGHCALSVLLVAAVHTSRWSMVRAHVLGSVAVLCGALSLVVLGTALGGAPAAAPLLAWAVWVWGGAVVSRGARLQQLEAEALRKAPDQLELQALAQPPQPP